MKTMTIERFREAPEEALRAARHEQVLLTLDGVPVAILAGVLSDVDESLDGPTAEGGGIPLEEDPDEFWRMIQQRRQDDTISWDEVMQRLFSEEDRQASKATGR